MSGAGAAALALAAAVALGGSPRSRLVPARHRGLSRRWSLAGALAVGGAVAAIALPPSSWPAGVVLAVTAALRHRRRVRHRRAVAEARALEAALDVLVGELRAGAHPLRAFAVAAGEIDHAGAAAGLRGVASRARLGADVATGLRDVAASSALPLHWERLAVYWDLGERQGLAIATLMRAAQREISSRQRFSDQADAAMAGARSSATILGCLPVLGVILGQLIGARPIGFLLGGSGAVLALVGVSLVCAGLLWSDAITAQAGGAG
ncbi:type II secretion system F family protein [Mycolicibacter minnesotensis]